MFKLSVVFLFFGSIIGVTYNIKWDGKWFLLFNIMDEFVWNWYNFLTCLEEFSSEVILSWSFLCVKALNLKILFFKNA